MTSLLDGRGVNFSFKTVVSAFAVAIIPLVDHHSSCKKLSGAKPSSLKSTMTVSESQFKGSKLGELLGIDEGWSLGLSDGNVLTETLGGSLGDSLGDEEATKLGKEVGLKLGT